MTFPSIQLTGGALDGQTLGPVDPADEFRVGMTVTVSRPWPPLDLHRYIVQPDGTAIPAPEDALPRCPSQTT